MIYLLLHLMLVGLVGCSGLEKSEQEKIRKANAKAESIARYDHEKYYEISFPQKKVREPYAWEKTSSHSCSKVTEEKAE